MILDHWSTIDSLSLFQIYQFNLFNSWKCLKVIVLFDRPKSTSLQYSMDTVLTLKRYPYFLRFPNMKPGIKTSQKIDLFSNNFKCFVILRPVLEPW